MNISYCQPCIIQKDVMFVVADVNMFFHSMDSVFRVWTRLNSPVCLFLCRVFIVCIWWQTCQP